MGEQASRLENFPVARFSVVMGLAGLTLAWQQAARFLATGNAAVPWLAGATVVVAAVLVVIYFLKLVRHPEAVRAEWRHPVQLAFVPTLSIALILVATVLRGWAAASSFWLWSMGTILHLVLTLYVLSSWMHHEHYHIQHLNPAWFIPVVGNVLVPLAGVEHAAPAISWFFFSVCLFFWPVLSAILFYRVIFHGALPAKLVPTLFIFIAPPAVGFLAYVKLTGGLDAMAVILYCVALFFTLLLLSQSWRFARLEFFLSWWAYSFPLAAIATATLRAAELSGMSLLRGLGVALLAVISLLVAGLAVRTGLAVARREICVKGG